MSIVVFGVSPTAVLTTSGVAIAVAGFAVRNMIADLFFGVTLALERPFAIGDWIQMPNGSSRRVTEFAWRAVKFVTRETLKVIV